MPELDALNEAIWIYTISKEKLFKRLVDDGVFTQADADEFLDMMYIQLASVLNPKSDISHIGELMKMSRIKTERTIASLTEIERTKSEKNPGYLIQSWLRSDNTVRFLRAWELEHNEEFDSEACDKLIEEIRKTGATLTPKLWCERTYAKGIVSTKGKGGGTKADPDIALAFRAWLEPELMLEMVSRFRYYEIRFKETVKTVDRL